MKGFSKWLCLVPLLALLCSLTCMADMLWQGLANSAPHQSLQVCARHTVLFGRRVRPTRTENQCATNWQHVLLQTCCNGCQVVYPTR